MTTASDELVCVTGATGFIAAQLVRELLGQGYRVRGTVRDRAKAEAAFAEAKLPGRERLELVTADLTEAGSFDAAMQGVTCLMHTASPYKIVVKDPQKELVEPALNGTLEVLAAARRAGVKRVVLTSSVAALTDEPEPGKKLTEADWNKKSSLTRNPYYYSKAVAERAAWDYVEKQRPGYSLVTMNPFMVIGPSLTASLNQSNELVRDMLTSKGFPGVFDLAWGFVDVRDVALAHVLAMMTPKARGRYLCAAQTLHMKDIVKVFKRAHLDERFALPTRDLSGGLGRFLVRLGSWFQPRAVGTFLRTNIGRRPEFDNRKIKRDLGLTFRSVEKSLLDTVVDLERWGHLDGRAKKGAAESDSRGAAAAIITKATLEERAMAEARKSGAISKESRMPGAVLAPIMAASPGVSPSAAVAGRAEEKTGQDLASPVGDNDPRQGEVTQRDLR